MCKLCASSRSQVEVGPVSVSNRLIHLLFVWLRFPSRSGFSVANPNVASTSVMKVSMKSRAKEKAAARRVRPKRKVAAAAERKAPNPLVIDLTEDKADTTQSASDQKTPDPMESPAHLASTDFFEVLNLSRSASEADVKKAYRKLAVQWHPDKNRANPRAEEFFKKISEAYEVLGDPEKRRLYEKYGRQGLDGAPQASDGGDGRFGFHRYQGFSTKHARDVFDAFFGGHDPFEAFFGARQRRGSSQRRGGFGDDPFESMGFGGMGTNMRGFGNMGGMSMMDSFFGDMGPGSFSTSMSTSSSSSTFTDRNGHVVTQKTTTTTGADGRTETVTEEYQNGKLVNSTSSSTGSRLADAGRMQLEGSSSQSRTRKSQSSQRRESGNSRPKY